MPQLSVSVPHALEVPEAMSRLRARAESIRTAYQSNVTDLEETWNDESMVCRFRALGQKFQGTLTVVPGEVQVQMDLPLMALMFRGAIESKAREEIGRLLA
jgi:hypothetical protein